WSKLLTLPVPGGRPGSPRGLAVVGGPGGGGGCPGGGGPGPPSVGAAPSPAKAAACISPPAVPGPGLPATAAVAAAFPRGWTAGTDLAGGTGLFAATDSGPQPVVVTPQAGGGRLGAPRSTGNPDA